MDYKKMSDKKETKIMLAAWVRRDLKERLKECATADNRSLSNLIERILTDYLDGHQAQS
jgi:molybdopterin-guanine dinucleotide biosynthesis protein A